MRTVGYAFAGYLILSYGSFALYTGGLTGLLTGAAAAAALGLLVRSYRRGRRLAAVDDAPDVDAVLRRLERRLHEVTARLPAEPLDSAAFVAVRHALLGRADGAGVAAEAEYAEARDALARASRDMERLVGDWYDDALARRDALAAARRLERELTAAEAYADRLDARARAADAPVAASLDG